MARYIGDINQYVMEQIRRYWLYRSLSGVAVSDTIVAGCQRRQ